LYFKILDAKAIKDVKHLDEFIKESEIKKIGLSSSSQKEANLNKETQRISAGQEEDKNRKKTEKQSAR